MNSVLTAFQSDFHPNSVLHWCFLVQSPMSSMLLCLISLTWSKTSILTWLVTPSSLKNVLPSVLRHSLFSSHCSCPSLSLPSILILALLFSSSMLTTNLKQSFHLNTLYNNSQFYISSPDLSLKFPNSYTQLFSEENFRKIPWKKRERKGRSLYFQQIFKSLNLYLALYSFLDEKIHHYEKFNYPKLKHKYNAIPIRISTGGIILELDNHQSLYRSIND